MKLSISALSEYVSIVGNKVYLLPVRNACNAKCVFCATTVYSPSVSVPALSGDVYSELIEKIRRCEVKTFEISGGGEPTLCRDLELIVKTTRKHFPNSFIKLYSNGIRLPSNPGIDELNISRGAYDPKSNMLLMGTGSLEVELSSVVSHARDLGYKRIRVSFPLCKGGVESTKDIQDIGNKLLDRVDAIVFRPLYDATPNRDQLLPSITERDLTFAIHWISQWNKEYAHRTYLEIDRYGIFRKNWLIIGSDGCMYRDFGLTERIEILDSSELN